MPDWIGQQLGNYRLIRQLGKGGFGQVYLGEQIYLNTHAAIKLVLSDVEGTQADAFRAAFLQEAQRIAQLKHPHILRVLEFGMQKSVPYLVMEYAAHGTLLERHPRGTRAPVDQVVSYTKQIAQALHYAHEARLIHRDVKPANVLLDERDTILLSDFGIATVAHHTSSMSTSNYAGTAAYMAPEQLQGRPVPASDQYALAIMVYEWLCGQLPYEGDPIAIGMQHLTAPIPSLCIHNKALSPTIEAVVQQALAKNPKQRFTTVLDFADALERATQPSSATKLHTVPQSQRKTATSQLSPVLNTPAARSLPRRSKTTPPVPTPVPTIDTRPPVQALLRKRVPKKPVKRSRSFVLWPIVLLLTLVIGSASLFGGYQIHAHQMSGDATTTANTLKYPSYLPGHGHLLLYDSLQSGRLDPLTHDWPTEDVNNNHSCSLSSDGYHISSYGALDSTNQYTSPQYEDPITCTPGTDVKDFALVTQMTLIRGDCAGANVAHISTQTDDGIQRNNYERYYDVELCRDGSYIVVSSVQDTNIEDNLSNVYPNTYTYSTEQLASGSTGMKLSLNQAYTVAFVRIGSNISFFINGKNVEHEDLSALIDSHLSNYSGHYDVPDSVGLSAYDNGDATEVAFSQAAVWSLE